MSLSRKPVLAGELRDVEGRSARARDLRAISDGKWKSLNAAELMEVA
jgi:hypothetical protein